MRTRCKYREGFTALELILTLFLISLVLTLAAHLMAQAQRRSVLEHRRALEPASQLAFKQLRADVTAAESGGGDWQRGEPLTLDFPSGLRIRYGRSGDELIRTVTEPPGQKVLLDGVTDFRWTWLGGSGIPLGSKPLLGIEVSYERIRTTGAQLAEARRIERQHLVLTLRGGGGVGW